MAKFIIKGGKKLEGEIEVKGMKNAATPILAASLLSDSPCLIENLPRITDVDNMIKLLDNLGAKIKWQDNHSCLPDRQTLEISCRSLRLNKLNKKTIQSMRSSILLLGPLLSRFGQVNMPEPGGCIIGNRPIDTHLYGFKKLGTKIKEIKGNYCLKANSLQGTTIILPEFSVTATENLIMASVKAKGETIIKLAAAEPHVQDLCRFLNKMGAKIQGIGTHTLKIKGVKKLNGVRYKIIPDQIEAGTFAVLAAATKSKILIKNVIPEHLEIILLKLEQIGVKFELFANQLLIYPSKSLKPFNLQVLPYPGFPTDLAAPFAVLASQVQGTSLIQDPLFESRMSYVPELIKMGANAIIADPHRVIINGPTPLYGTEIRTFDLRAGATLIIAGLVASGETVINQAEIVDRGYEKIEERLSRLGAEIKRI